MMPTLPSQTRVVWVERVCVGQNAPSTVTPNGCSTTYGTTDDPSEWVVNRRTYSTPVTR